MHHGGQVGDPHPQGPPDSLVGDLFRSHQRGSRAGNQWKKKLAF